MLNVSKLNSTWTISNRIFYSGFICYLFSTPKKIKKIFSPFANKKDVIKLINFAFLGLLICQGIYFLSIKYTNSSIATILQYLGPTMIMFYYCIAKKDCQF
ncbi:MULTISPECIES: EamA family transporter [unclassified Gemella]|uniref:EamA family transporter n=1 Tax=unclassified Gemella TaxID=2624949 RepID=UPI00207B3171|nr:MULTISPECIES: EamA family transporter [unclassified Gemella]